MTETLAPIKPGKLIINGEAVDAASGKTFTTTNPATEEPICEVAQAGPEDVERAVKAAREAFENGPWSKMKPAERQKILWRLGDLVLQHADERTRISPRLVQRDQGLGRGEVVLVELEDLLERARRAIGLLDLVAVEHRDLHREPSSMRRK